MTDQPLYGLRNYNDPNYRNVFPIPLDDDFYNLLQDQLHKMVKNTLFGGNANFTLFVNALNRKEEKKYGRMDSPDFIYAGLKKQRDLLKNLYGNKKTDIDKTDVDAAWEYLTNEIISYADAEVGSSIYTKIQQGEYQLDDICQISFLKDYFSTPARKYIDAKEAENIIVGEYFNIEFDVFVSIPLIGYAEFDGMIHIIFKKELLHKIPGYIEGKMSVPKQIMWILLRNIIVQYDDLFLRWDSIGENIEKLSAIYDFILNTVFKSDEYFNRAIDSPSRPLILKELDLQQYYTEHAEYFIRCLRLGEFIPGRFYEQYLINAITAILIDSYAHNVSAHALSTLSWWFYRRARYLGDEELDWNALFDHLKQDQDFQDIPAIQAFERAIETRHKRRSDRRNIPYKKPVNQTLSAENGGSIAHYPGSMAREMATLLRFLMEKGAYWSGVTRDINVGGKISSLYSILWYDFVNNPLYLGTIAKTEDIQHIKIKLFLYEPDSSEEGTLFHSKRFSAKKQGILAEVDLKNPRKSLADEASKSPHEEILSIFIRKGADFKELRKLLKEIKIFFPGGVVGKHAFFTMLENEIRNVKHYSHEELKRIQASGLTLAIGIQPFNLKGGLQKEELYRMSIWLEAPTRLGKNGDHLIERKWETLKGDLFTERYTPRLGGTFQDKVCAAFLFNNRFSSAQCGDRNETRDKTKDTDRDKHFYPWIRPACSALDPESIKKSGVHKDFKISYNNPETGSTDEELPLVAPNLPTLGYLKKVFYLWKGENLLEWKDVIWEDDELKSWDNPSRFRIVHIPEKNEISVQILRSRMGIIRIAEGNLESSTSEERFREAYKKWLFKLLDNDFFAIRFFKDGDPSEQIILDARGSSINFYYDLLDRTSGGSLPQNVLDVISPYFSEDQSEYPENIYSIHLVHKGDDAVELDNQAVRYRNHGVYRTIFFPQDKRGEVDFSNNLLMMEFMEVMATKVCIFDNRIYHRMRVEKNRAAYKAFLRDKMKLSVHKEMLEAEKSSHWLQYLDENELHFIKNCHFLVMHLSFIESILKQKKNHIGLNETGNVRLFIEEEIIPLVGNRENFFFVVTTGRGRNEWWNSLENKQQPGKSYKHITLFRPVESLLSSIENSINIQDDIELKYRLVKILYGS